MGAPDLRVVRREAAELSDREIERLMDFGKREAELIGDMEQAVRAGDRNLVWQIAEALVRSQDAARQVTEDQ
jgi:hypothetical protein